ncbi:MAG: cytochrome c class I [Bacteroidetes bacterium]|nr:cytochrome c class I [Bacteroidota bacterium]
MKKISITLFALMLLGACGSGGDKKEAAPAPASAGSSLSSNPDYQKGLELIAKSDCLTCHKVGEKLIGPSYKDVSAKYESNDVKGGQGVWGQIPMTAHPQLSEADAKQMVKYILLLKTAQ